MTNAFGASPDVASRGRDRRTPIPCTSRSRDSAPGRWYWYRFKAGSELSPVGHTRTAPAVGAKLSDLRFAFASCQHYEHGYYTAYRHMAREALDLVVHLGDYIYEGSGEDIRSAHTRCGARKSQRLPEPLRAVPIRSRSASGPRRISLGRDMG